MKISDGNSTKNYVSAGYRFIDLPAYFQLTVHVSINVTKLERNVCISVCSKRVSKPKGISVGVSVQRSLHMCACVVIHMQIKKCE